jgi:hypothetical protein
MNRDVDNQLRRMVRLGCVVWSYVGRGTYLRLDPNEHEVGTRLEHPA